MKNNSRIEDLKKCFGELDCIVPIIDKIGSGFQETEETALALLLYFNKEKVLDKLAEIRKIISNELKDLLGEEQFDEFIEQEDGYMWKPPYNASKEKILKMLEEEQ